MNELTGKQEEEIQEYQRFLWTFGGKSVPLFVYEIGNGRIGCSFVRRYVVAQSEEQALAIYKKSCWA